MAHGSMDVRHKSQAYLCVQDNSITNVFPMFLIIPCILTGIPTTYLFPDFTCSRLLLVYVMAKQVKHFTHSIREENVFKVANDQGSSSANFKSSLLVFFGPYTGIHIRSRQVIPDDYNLAQTTEVTPKVVRLVDE